MRKRDREVDPTDEVLNELAATLERGGAELKHRALDKVIAAVDPADDTYANQKALVNGDAAFYITELLSDPAACTKAAEAVAAVCRHSAPSVARLTAGPLVGLDSSVERVSLNPCQSDFVDSGALAALCPMLVSRQEAAREAAAAAVSALCSFNQEGKLAYLEGLVQLLLHGAQPEALPQILEMLEGAIDGMECGGEAAAQQLDLLLPPLLSELQKRGRPSSLAALGLLGTLCEKHAAAAEQLRAGGAVALAAQHLLHGAQPVQDAAARALWLLARGERRCLSAAGEAEGAGQGQLGCDPLALAQVLVKLLERAEAQEARRQEEEEAEADEGAGEEASTSGFQERRFEGEAAAGEQLYHAEEASELLRALAAAHPAVSDLVEEQQPAAVRPGSHCCIS